MRPVWSISYFMFARLALIGLLPLFITIATAKASFVSTTPTLPDAGVSYTDPTGFGCLAAAGFCVSSGTLTLNSVASQTFNAAGQDVVSNATFVGSLTTLGNTPIGPVTLTGTVDQEVLGRTFSTQTGSWTTALMSLSLAGSVLGHTLTVGLNPSQTSGGTTSIVPSGNSFLIDSFFSVFLSLSFDSTPPVSTDVGSLQLTLSSGSPVSATPLPPTWTMMLIGLAGFGFVAHRRKSTSALRHA
jgi:hypothetical protein